MDGYAHVWDPDPEKIRASQGNMALGENYYHGGLMRFDLTPKPAYMKLNELIKKRWHTEAEIVTDENGIATFRGFFGGYDVETVADGVCEKSNIELSSGGENTFCIELK